MTDPGPESLAAHLAWLKTEDCPCPHRWRSHGRLYGVSMGHGWGRTDTDSNCRHHGDPFRTTTEEQR